MRAVLSLSKYHHVVFLELYHLQVFDVRKAGTLDLGTKRRLVGPDVCCDPARGVRRYLCLITVKVYDDHGASGLHRGHQTLHKRLGVLEMMVDVADEGHVDAGGREAGLRVGALHHLDGGTPRVLLCFFSEVLAKVLRQLDSVHRSTIANRAPERFEEEPGARANVSHRGTVESGDTADCRQHCRETASDVSRLHILKPAPTLAALSSVQPHHFIGCSTQKIGVEAFRVVVTVELWFFVRLGQLCAVVLRLSRHATAAVTVGLLSHLVVCSTLVALSSVVTVIEDRNADSCEATTNANRSP
eukprot:m.168765 g.168765  ORF g.168765 m.168765 type:complete len:301 (+) comp24132_c0_seq1:166-1068(+)